VHPEPKGLRRSRELLRLAIHRTRQHDRGRASRIGERARHALDQEIQTFLGSNPPK